MQAPNYKRMFELIDEVFATRDDPSQLQVNEAALEKLTTIHPSTLSELANDQGPVIWSLVIPTTNKTMNNFLNGKISENEILTQTKPGEKYDAIYLCSVTTLPEFRSKGESKKLCLRAIEKMRNDHPIQTLFVWSFTKEGEKLAESLSKICGLPLLKKEHLK